MYGHCFVLSAAFKLVVGFSKSLLTAEVSLMKAENSEMSKCPKLESKISKIYLRNVILWA